MWDSNLRVGRLQETTAELPRAGESIDSGPVAKHLIGCLSRNDSGNAIVHGRLCPWGYTFQPVGQKRRSVIDMCVMPLDKVLEAGVCHRDVADIGSDHKAIYVRAEFPGFSVDRLYGAKKNAKGKATQSPYSRRRLRECDPSVVRALVAQMI